MSEGFELAPWRTVLARAIHRNRSQPHHRFFQLATVTPEGFPSNRTVVFRGFVENANQLKIIGDRRSEKINHLRHNNRAEIAWYFTKTREQFRLSGTISCVTASDFESPFNRERQHTWQSLSDAARSQFLWADPATVRSENTESFNPPLPDPENPVDTFVLLIFEPTKVDHLELRGDPQNRYLYRRNLTGDWEKAEVNP